MKALSWFLVVFSGLAVFSILWEILANGGGDSSAVLGLLYATLVLIHGIMALRSNKAIDGVELLG